jgi:hypothetical protein
VVDSHYELQCGAESLPEQTFGFDAVLQDSCARDTSVLTTYKHTSTFGHKSVEIGVIYSKEYILLLKLSFIVSFDFNTFSNSAGNCNVTNITVYLELRLLHILC